MKRCTHHIALVCTVLLLGGCATAPPPTVELAAPTIESDLITFHAEQKAIGELLREVGPLFSRGVVIMNGLEDRVVGPYEFEGVSEEEIVRQISLDSQTLIRDYDDYTFIYAPGYDILTQVSVDESLPLRFASARTTITLGAGTSLFNAFALLGYGVEITVLAGNLMASAECGELRLVNASMSSAVEAILQSARIHNEAYAMKVGENYVFLHSAANRLRHPVLLNQRTLSRQAQNYLSNIVDVQLPANSTAAPGIAGAARAEPLGNTLAALSHQLGVRVRAHEELMGIPVNPMALRGVTVAEAMELLIYQWPVPEFGYEALPGEIILRQATE